MRITVKESAGKDIRLRLPSGLVLNSLSATVFSEALKDKGVNISVKQLQILFQTIKAYKATHPEWKLVEVYDHDGTVVEIVL